MTDLWTKLKQRKLVQWALAYVAFAFALLQGLDIVAQRFDWPAGIERGLIVALVVGFFAALVIAWYHGERGEQRVTGMEVLLLAVLLAVGGGFLWQFTRSPREYSPQGGTPALVSSKRAPADSRTVVAEAQTSSAAIPAKSIAVLPFENLSGDKNQQYFSDGITEDLLNLLSRIPQLQVTARTSSFWFRGKHYTIPQIAEKLHVAYILEGSVQKAGDEVRISVQLVNAASDTQRWSQTYDRRLKDVFKIQDEIGADVVKHLKVRLLGKAPEVKQADPRAYTLYLQARQLGYQDNPKALKQSDALYRQALAVDPRYAQAWVGLADNTINRIWWTTGSINWNRNYEQALAYTRKAAEINPDSATAQSMLGYLAMMYKSDFKTAARHIQRALALEPASPDVLNTTGRFLYLLNRSRQAMAVIKRARRLDPVDPDIYRNAALVFVQQGRWHEAIVAEQKGNELSPDSGTGHAMIAWFEVAQGRAKVALAELQKEQGPTRLVAEPAVYCALGRKTEAEKALESLVKRRSASAPAAIASAYADCGDAGRAFAWLDKAADLHTPVLGMTIYGASFRKYHQDPRWKAFLRKAGFAPDQLAKIKFEVKLPEPSAVECRKCS